MKLIARLKELIKGEPVVTEKRMLGRLGPSIFPPFNVNVPMPADTPIPPVFIEIPRDSPEAAAILAATAEDEED